MNDILTFLFTDIEGSTQLWEQYPEAMKLALARHDLILRQAIEAHGGQVFKTVGDAFCAAFPNAPDAALAALDAQMAISAESWGETPIKVRMGLHAGATEQRDNDYFGPTLNRVARLMSAGHGGQTLLSAITRDLVQASLPDGVELCDMGERGLKDLIRPEHIYQLTAPGLQTDFPPLKTLDVLRTNLPAQLTSFVGREKEIAKIKQLITANRFITLTGPGGTGKTRLSLQVAADLLDSFPEGVWFVELAPLADPALIPQTLLNILGLREETARPVLDTLTNYFRSKKTLLILDNCEHLIQASAQLAQDLLQICPALHILVSSREALGITGESAYHVPSLSIPDVHHTISPETLMQYEATQLFMDRAQTVQPNFIVAKENVAAIVQICVRLDGIPLAIELAAARVKMLNVEQIAERLDDRFRLLTGGSRTALPRQQTLRAMIDWSYDLLPEAERVLLRRLSVFADGWTLEAAEAVCQGPGIDDYNVLDPLAQLVNKSLVALNVDDRIETRYYLLETVRQYAREKLSETDEGKTVRDLHLQYFLGLAERAKLELTGPAMAKWLKRLDHEFDNLRAALEWSMTQDAEIGLRLATALMRYWPYNGDMREGTRWLSQLLHLPTAATPNITRAEALTALGFLSFSQGGSKVEPFAREGLDIYRKLDDKNGIAFALYVLGTALWLQDNFLDSHAFMLESLALYKTANDKLGMSIVLGAMGNLLNTQGHAQKRIYLEESLLLSREIGYVLNIASQLRNLGELACRSGDYATARTQLTESLETYHSLGANFPPVMDQLGELAFREGNYEQARVYLEECLSVTQEKGHIVGSCWLLNRLGYIALRQGNQTHARSLFIEAQKGFKEVSSKLGVTCAIEGLTSLALVQQQPARAASLFAWIDQARIAVGDCRPPVEQADVDRDIAIIRAQIDEATFAAAQGAGRAMSMDEAIALALEATHD